MRYTEKTNPDTSIKRNARTLRDNQTVPEAILWKRLRNRRLGGFKFRRQYPIGQFIVDFYCHQVQLAIELDGRSHEEQSEYDSIRSQWLTSNDITIIRFSNQQLAQNLDGMCNAILAECERLLELQQ